MQECELSRIVLRDTAEEQYIFLREKNGEGRIFPILIGRFEARAIDRTVRRQAFPRPMTHDLLAAVVEAAGVQLERVEITDLREGTYFASLHLRRETETVKVDARPSDAVALAVRLGCPIFVADAVLAEAAEK